MVTYKLKFVCESDILLLVQVLRQACLCNVVMYMQSSRILNASPRCGVHCAAGIFNSILLISSMYFEHMPDSTLILWKLYLTLTCVTCISPIV